MDLQNSMCTSMEVEYDSDEEQDVGAELNTWLSQLGTAATKLDDNTAVRRQQREKQTFITQSHTMESFRCSVVMDLDNGGNCGDLDDIISDLCALEAELTDAQKEFHTKQPVTDGDSGNIDDMYSSNPQTMKDNIETVCKTSSNGYNIPPSSVHVIKVPSLSSGTLNNNLYNRANTLDRTPTQKSTPNKAPLQTSCGSSETSAAGSSHTNSSSGDGELRAKEEKILIAIQKIRAADIKKLFVKVFIQNGECKTILVDEKMTVSEVLVLLYEKCEVKPNVRWTLVEQIPDLYIERIIEDHEKLLTVMMNWQKISNNKILFLETDDKYDLFFQPQRYLLNRDKAEKCLEKEQRALLDELFGGAGTHVPEMESEIYHKLDGQKTWKKVCLVLRTSGLYIKKGKTSRNLQCITQFDQVEIYRGFGWRKKYKAPTEHCFALKHPKLQKKSKDIRYFCCEDEYTLKKWLMGTRIAKYGKALHAGFKNSLEVVGGKRKPSSAALDTPSDSMSQSSRDSGFSVTSDSSNSLDAAQHSSAVKSKKNGGIPPPPDEFSDLPPPPPELLGEEPTPTNTPIHFAHVTNEFAAMHIGQCSSDDGEGSVRSSGSSSVSSHTPRNSISSNGTPTKKQNFDRHTGIRNSLRRTQSPTTPKLVAPPKVPTKVAMPPTLPPPQDTYPQSNHAAVLPQTHVYGHYGNQCYQPPIEASSLSVTAPMSTAKNTNGQFLAELNSLYAYKGVNSTAAQSAESDSDVDELPPPPPELLSPDYADNTYEVPYGHGTAGITAVSNGIYSTPPPPLEYNPYGERKGYEANNHMYSQGVASNQPNESYSMSRVFASQTGTIKRAPPPPKRNNSIGTMQRHPGMR